MIEFSEHDVFVEVIGEQGSFTPTASVQTFTFPDGSTRATGLDPDELREVAVMIESAADELEEVRGTDGD